MICLPPAGAGPSLFNPWKTQAPALLVPSIPGKEARFRDPIPPDLTSLARLLAGEIAPKLHPPYRIFGYSMGGALGFELARALIVEGLPEPEHLAVLGALPPQELNTGLADIHMLDSASFWAEIRELGGTPDEILQSVEMKDLLEPILRADFALCARHLHDDSKLGCPITVLRAKDDNLLDANARKGWQSCTTGPARETVIEGRHMLNAQTFNNLPDLLNRIMSSNG